MTINETAADVAATSKSKGFEPPNESNIDQKLLLVISEICEAQEELRFGKKILDVYYKGMERPYYSAGGSMKHFPLTEKPEGFAIELADAIIRLFHIGHALGINLQEVIDLKARYNRTREHKHGRQF
jgi:NTP pyrophosphatase (non-canonical NTP hydrolase)